MKGVQHGSAILALLGVGFGDFCGDDGNFCQTGFAGRGFGFCDVYPHAGDYCGVECVFDLCEEVAAVG